MDLTLDDDQLLLAESARQLFERTYTTESAREAEDLPDGFSADLWKQACELGWPGIALPEECGGAGYGALELAVLAEELGRGAATLPLLSSYAATLPLLWAAPMRCGRAGWRRWPQARRSRRWRSPIPGAPTLQVTATDDGWTVSGTKVAVPFGCVADVLVVSVDLGDWQPSLVAIAADAPGVSCRRHDTFAPDPFAAVTFTDVAIGRDDVVGDALGPRARARAPDRGRHRVRGRASRGGALALAVDHASNREQFGRPIGVNQAVSHQCVDMRVEIDAMRVLALQAAWRLDRYDADPAGATRAVALANAYARDVLPGIFARAHQVHGAIGFTMEYDLQLFTRQGEGLRAHRRGSGAPPRTGGALDRVVAVTRRAARSSCCSSTRSWWRCPCRGAATSAWASNPPYSRGVVSTSVACARSAPTVHSSRVRCSNGSNWYQRHAFSHVTMSISLSGRPTSSSDFITTSGDSGHVLSECG